MPAGLLWAFFWTGFMRVGSQASLFLAPIATVVLVLAWISVRTPPSFVLDSSYTPNSSPIPLQVPARRTLGLPWRIGDRADSALNGFQPQQLTPA